MSKCIKFCIKFVPNQAKWGQGASKIDQNGTLERSESDLGNWVEKMLRPGYGFWWFFMLKINFWWFLGSLKIQGGAKNGPTNSIRRLFGTTGRPKGANKSFLEGVEKRIDFWIVFGWISGGKVSQNDAKMDVKIIEFSMRFRSLRFLVFGKKPNVKYFFYMIREAKNNEKSIKNRCKNDVRKNDAKRSRKGVKREPKMIKNPGILC